jgi:hypothetical protein
MRAEEVVEVVVVEVVVVEVVGFAQAEQSTATTTHSIAGRAQRRRVFRMASSSLSL